MRTTHVTTKSREQIAADFAAVFASIQPIVAAKPLTAEERLARFRKEIMKQRRRGLSWRQIAAGMADPRINEKVSEKLLRTVFAPRPAARPAAAAGPVPTPPPTPTPSPRRLILDPLTGQRITPR